MDKSIRDTKKQGVKTIRALTNLIEPEFYALFKPQLDALARVIEIEQMNADHEIDKIGGLNGTH